MQRALAIYYLWLAHQRALKRCEVNCKLLRHQLDVSRRQLIAAQHSAESARHLEDALREMVRRLQAEVTEAQEALRHERIDHNKLKLAFAEYRRRMGIT